MVLCSGSALAFPSLDRLPPGPLVPERAAASYDFTGIVAFSNCSGSVVRFDDSLETDQALVLTNGHCTGSLIDPGVVYVNQAANRTISLLNDKASKVGSVHADLLVYGAMTKTDLALYRLKETYADLHAKYQAEALTLAREAPAVGTAIQVISGYWKKGYSCSIEAIASTLEEGDWTFHDSVRYSRPGCDVIGGTSGSPVLAAGTRTVVAVNNTINESGKKCTENNPCEVNADGSITATKGFGYAQETYWLYSCRDAGGAIDLSVEGCLLQQPAAND